MPNKTLARNAKNVPVLSAQALERIAAHNIALPNDEQLAAGNFSVRLINDDIHSDIFVMQMLTNIFKADKNKAADFALKLHTNGSAVIFTGSRDNCRLLMRQIALHGGCAAANLMLGIDNDNSLTTEMVRNSDGSIVQRSDNNNGGEIVPANE